MKYFMQKLLLSFMVIIVSFQLNTVLSQEDEEEYESILFNFLSDFFNYERFNQSLTLAMKFNDAGFNDTISSFEDKMDTEFNPICYFDPSITYFWPGFFRGFQKNFYKGDDNILMEFSYMPVQANSTPLKYNIEASVNGNHTFNLDLLDYHLDFNIKDDVLLEDKEIKNAIWFSLNSFYYGQNQNVLCQISPVRDPLEDAINELKNTSKEAIDAYNTGNEEESNEETGNTNPEVTSVVNDDVVMLMVKNIPQRLTAEDIEYIKDYEGFTGLYEAWLDKNEAMQKQEQLYYDLIELSRESNLCEFIDEIDEQKEDETQELYTLINNNANNEEVKKWLKNYILDKLTTEEQE